MLKTLRLARRLSTARNLQSDIAIVGAGPAGLTLAAALKNNKATRHLTVTLVEASSLDPIKQFQKTPPEKFSNRISSLTSQTVEYLDHIGAWQHIHATRTQPFDNIVAYDGLSDARIEFDNDDLGTMCENANLQQALLARVSEFGGVTVADKSRVEAISTSGASSATDWPIVTLSDGSTVTARLLVGADGFNSPVRRFAGIETRGWAYGRFGVVANVELEYEDFRSTAWQRFLPTGPLALLPMPGKKCTIVWSTTPELSQLLTTLPSDILARLVNCGFVLSQPDLDYYYGLLQRGAFEEFTEDYEWRYHEVVQKHANLGPDAPELPLSVVNVEAKSVARFPLKLSHCDTYVGTRTALIGDAAHTTHPLAGQGLNMGQSDARHLCEALEKAVARGLDIGSPLALEPYWANAYPRNEMLLAVVDGLHKLYSVDWAPVVQARSLGLSLVNEVPFLKDLMMKSVSGK